MRIPQPKLQQQTEAILAAWGMSPAHAATTAARLAHADLRGIDSHGVALIVLYEQLRNEGRLNFQPQIKVLRETAVTALIDADASLGHVPSTMAMEMAIAKGREAGLSAVAVRGSNHYGAAGAYSLLAAEAGLIGLSFTSVWNSVIVPAFGAQPMFGTNPISFAAPGSKQVFYLDMATSTVAVGKVKLADLHGKPMPEGWVVDHDGKPQPDAAAALKQGIRLTPLGGTRPLGSHKGYGLAAMVEVLCSMLAGAWYAPTKQARHPNEVRHNIGHFFMTINPTAFRAPGEFEDDLDDMMDALHGSRPADPAQPVLVPGDPELAAMDERTREGVPVPDALLAQLKAIAAKAGAGWIL